MSFYSEILLCLVDVLVECGIINWVQDNQNDEIYFVSMGTHVYFKLRPFRLYFKLFLHVFERSGQPCLNLSQNTHLII